VYLCLNTLTSVRYLYQIKNKTMKTVIKLVLTLIIGTVSLTLEAQDTFQIKVKVNNAENNNGKIFLGLYNSEDNFLNKQFKSSKSELNNNGCEIIFKNIPAGTYAVSVFHDENDNGKMDANFIGIPKEDYGCSNDAKGFMGPPKWEDAKFSLNEDTTVTIKL